MKKAKEFFKNLDTIQIILLIFIICCAVFLIFHKKYCLDLNTNNELIEKKCFRTIKELNKEKIKWENQSINSSSVSGSSLLSSSEYSSSSSIK